MSSSKSRLVAATTRTSTGMASVPPTGIASRSWSTRNSFTWVAGDISPISSRKNVPPRAAANMPCLSRTAPVNDPFTWPNSSDSSRVSVGMCLSAGLRAPVGHHRERALPRGLRGQGDHRGRGFLVPRRREDLGARNARHLDVREDDVGWAPLQRLKPGFPTLRRGDVESLPLQENPQHVQDPHLVVHYENRRLVTHAGSSIPPLKPRLGPAAEAASAAASAVVAQPRVHSRVSCCFFLPASGGEINRECRPLPRWGVHEHQPAMRVHRALHDGEAQAGAAHPTGDERLEQAGPQGFGDARAVVAHREGYGALDAGPPPPPVGRGPAGAPPTPR